MFLIVSVSPSVCLLSMGRDAWNKRYLLTYL